VADGVVYVESNHGGVALNASNGALVWQHGAWDGGAESSPAVVNGVVYLGSDDGNLYAFHLPNQ
jgi:outer membrane protein assembly factor BamB